MLAQLLLLVIDYRCASIACMLIQNWSLPTWCGRGRCRVRRRRCCVRCRNHRDVPRKLTLNAEPPALQDALRQQSFAQFGITEPACQSLYLPQLNKNSRS